MQPGLGRSWLGRDAQSGPPTGPAHFGASWGSLTQPTAHSVAPTHRRRCCPSRTRTHSAQPATCWQIRGLHFAPLHLPFACFSRPPPSLVDLVSPIHPTTQPPLARSHHQPPVIRFPFPSRAPRRRRVRLRFDSCLAWNRRAEEDAEERLAFQNQTRDQHRQHTDPACHFRSFRTRITHAQPSPQIATESCSKNHLRQKPESEDPKHRCMFF